MSLRSYKDLDVWKLGVELAATVDELSEKLISCRRFAMANQICRAALSVPAFGPLGVRLRSHRFIARQ